MSQIEHGPPREEFAEVFRYYTLAKRAEWQVRDLPWNELPPIPESKGSPERQARRRDIWRSVITQQLQADELAVEMATQLFALRPTTSGLDVVADSRCALGRLERAAGAIERLSIFEHGCEPVEVGVVVDTMRAAQRRRSEVFVRHASADSGWWCAVLENAERWHSSTSVYRYIARSAKISLPDRPPLRAER